MTNLILIGFMGSGKSTIAKCLASLLGLQAVEMDDLVCQKAGAKSVHEVFAQEGEIVWRSLEIEVAKELSDRDGLIIATGGGVVINKIILDYLKLHGGIAIFLRSSFKEIANRLQGDGSRPLFQNKRQAEALYTFRQPLYEAYADLIIDVDGISPDQIASEITTRIEQYGF
jgi:shikimate kinase